MAIIHSFNEIYILLDNNTKIKKLSSSIIFVKIKNPYLLDMCSHITFL